MIKIESLTDEQIARFPEFVDRWIKVGLNTERADRSATEAAAVDAYREGGGLTRPDWIIWCDSPLSLCLADVALKNKNLTSVRESVGATVVTSVRDSVWDSVRESVWDSVRESVGATVVTSVRASVWASVRESVWDGVRESVWDSVVTSVRDTVWDSVFGQHEAGWLSFYSYFLDVCNLRDCKRLSPLMRIAESSGWWIPRRNVVLFSERPIRCEVNARKVLHSDGKMAIEYSDGFGVYANDGVRLPAEIGKIKIVDWKPEWVLSQENQEIKRVLLENIPSERLANVLQLKSLDKFRSARSEYELVEAQNNPYPSRYRALRFTCPSTGRPYLVRVQPDVDTAEAAIIMLNKGTHPDKFIWEH